MRRVMSPGSDHARFRWGSRRVPTLRVTPAPPELPVRQLPRRRLIDLLAGPDGTRGVRPLSDRGGPARPDSPPRVRRRTVAVPPFAGIPVLGRAERDELTLTQVSDLQGSARGAAFSSRPRRLALLGPAILRFPPRPNHVLRNRLAARVDSTGAPILGRRDHGGVFAAGEHRMPARGGRSVPAFLWCIERVP